MILQPTEAELWDVSGAQGVRFLFESAKALLTGRQLPNESSGERHDKVQLR